MRQSEPGDPPSAALIQVSEPDADGVVTISGAAGAVFPVAQVAIRNLYTQQTVYTSAGFSGTFEASLYGPGNTPFLITAAESIPAAARNPAAALPGGPATIVYGGSTPPQPDLRYETPLLLDGRADDWVQLTGDDEPVQALANDESLYVLLGGLTERVVTARLDFAVNETAYVLTVSPDLPEAGLLRLAGDTDAAVQAIPVASAQDEAAGSLELRFPLGDLIGPQDGVRLVRAELSGASGVQELEINLPVTRRAGRDAAIFAGGRQVLNGPRFYVAGPVAQGASYWSATGRVNTLTPDPLGELVIEMDLTLNTSDLPESLTGLALQVELALQPVAVGEGAALSVPALHSNNGWSNLTTPSGLAIDNVRGDVPLGRIDVPPGQVVRRGDALLAALRWQGTLPSGLPPGLYVPTLRGTASVGDGVPFGWHENGLLGQGEGIARETLTRLPLVLNTTGADDARLPWALLLDTPSDGSRGLLAEADAENLALSNRVRFNSPTYVLPPGAYSLEPFILNQLPNAYDVSAAPLVSLLFPGGRLLADITRPDGTVETLSEAAVVQNRLSTATFDERDRFGAQSPLDTYQLVADNAAYRAYDFSEYGTYELAVRGSVDDRHGNRYAGGGAYQLLIAEPLDLTPGVLSGTPFLVGDAPFIGGWLAPGLPAEVTVRLDIYPLEGEPTQQTFSGTADQHGYFALDTAGFRFSQPGEYRLDYEVRFSDGEGRLWAASQRSAGVIAAADGDLVARGKRGLLDDPGLDRAAWFNSESDSPAQSPYILNTPYFSGDVAVVADDDTSGVNGVLAAQDRAGRYRDWLFGSQGGLRSVEGEDLAQLAGLDALPLRSFLGGGLGDFGPALLPDFLVSTAYSYISATRPDVTVRQYVIGDDRPILSLHWDTADPLNGQPGAGAAGLAPGDYVFLFGGTVIRNAEAGVRETAPYAALAVVVDEDTASGVYPAFGVAAGGAVGPPLLPVGESGRDVFFLPGGVRPGQVIAQGSPFVIAGQIGPPLQGMVEATITAPDGTVRMVAGRSNALGLFYDPATVFEADQAGVWTVELVVTGTGRGSVGAPQPPLPQGTVPGVRTETFDVYVIPPGTPALRWSADRDVDRAFPAGLPFNFSVNVPTGWTDVDARYALRTASYLLDSGTLGVFSGTVAYQLNPAQIAQDTPFEASGDGDGPAGSDVVTLTVVMDGLDADGRPAIRARSFLLLHDRLLSVDTLANDAIANVVE